MNATYPRNDPAEPCTETGVNALVTIQGHRVSVRAAGAGQWVQGGLAEPPAGVRGSLGVAQRRAWAVRAQRHLTFAVLSIHSFF